VSRLEKLFKINRVLRYNDAAADVLTEQSRGAMTLWY